MRNLLVLLITLLTLSETSLAQQTVTGRVLDAETGLPVPFVNIGIEKIGLGTVGNSDGIYRLEYRSESDVVLFSSIGYEAKNILLSDLINNPTVQLIPKIEILKEVLIRANKYGRDVILGEKLDNKGNSIGFAGQLLGTEIGAHIKVKRETAIKSAHFTINFTGADSLLFRVNLYDFARGKVGKKILKENVIIRAPQRKGTFDVDLMPYQLVVSNDVLLSLEWVQDNNGIGNQGLMFRSKKVASRSNLYTKSTSFAGFKKLTEQVPVAPNLKIGFYLKGDEEQ